jgi:hypothetical protein
VQETIKSNVLPEIKDDVQRQSMENSIRTYADPKQALLSEVDKVLKGTESQDRFTQAELLKALDDWLPGGKIRRRFRNPQASGSDVLSLTSSMASSSLDAHRPSQQNILSAADEANNVSAIDATTNAAHTSGFMYDEPSPSELADAFLQRQSEDGKQDSESRVDWILRYLRNGYIDCYLTSMFKMALETVTSQIDRMAQGCLAE